jgi:hypothetical protein
LIQATSAIAGKLRANGIFLATLRDYDTLVLSQPTIQLPVFYKGQGGERIVHQVWRWHGDQYEVHLYLTIPDGPGWIVKHFSSRYRALLRAELNDALLLSGFREIEWLEPSSTLFYQPIVVARKTNRGGNK